jgi:hypothetical protein
MAAAFLFRHIETGARKWLLAAGICSGLSFVIKIAGLYCVAGVGLFLFYREQETSIPEGSKKREWGYTVFLALSLVTLLALLLGLVYKRGKPAELIHFVVPGAALAAVLLRREWRESHLADRERFRSLFGLLGPFACGVAAPIVIFLIPYLLSSGLPNLYHNVFVAPAERFTFNNMDLPGLLTFTAAFPLAGVFALVLYGRTRIGWLVGGLMTLPLIGLLAYSAHTAVYRAIWYSIRPLVPLTVLAGVALLIRGNAPASANHAPAQPGGNVQSGATSPLRACLLPLRCSPGSARSAGFSFSPDGMAPAVPGGGNGILFSVRSVADQPGIRLANGF